MNHGSIAPFELSYREKYYESWKWHLGQLKACIVSKLTNNLSQVILGQNFNTPFHIHPLLNHLRVVAGKMKLSQEYISNWLRLKP